MKRVALLLAVFALPAAAQETELDSVPERFHGHWALTVEQCTAGPLDDANVRVGAKLVEDWQTRMEVSSVWVDDDDDGMLILSGRVTVDGDTANAYDNAKRLELFDEDGGVWLAVGEGEDRAVYVRCAS